MAILIFDFDGTIHDTMRIYAPAMRACYRMLVKQGLIGRRHPENGTLDQDLSDDLIRYYLGLSAQEMWQHLAPELSEEQQEAGSRYIYREMDRLEDAGAARLYDGACEVLKALKSRGHYLVFLSNCSVNYKTRNTRVLGLDQYFDEMYCSEEFAWAEKHEIVAELVRRWRQQKQKRELERCEVRKQMQEQCEAAQDQRKQMQEQCEAAQDQRKQEQCETQPSAAAFAAAEEAATKLTLTEHNVSPEFDIIVIGDRETDMEIRDAATLLQKETPPAICSFQTIFCTYGFGGPGEGAGADARVRTPSEILRAIDEIQMPSISE